MIQPEPRNNWKIAIDTGGTFTDCIAQDPNGQLLRLKVLSEGCLRGRALSAPVKAQLEIRHNWPVADSIFTGYRLENLHGQLLAMVVDFLPDNNRLILDRDPELDFPADFQLSAGEEAPILAARLATATPLDRELPGMHLRIGTTKGTNALLEQKGARTVLICTKGFADLLYIGNQQRPDLFQLNIPEPTLLYEQVLELDERIDANGRVERTPDPNSIRDLIRELSCIDPESIAVCFLNAYANPLHERQLKKNLLELGFPSVSISTELTPTIQLLPRMQATLVNAYLEPVLNRYLSNIREKVPLGTIQVMTSSGGLADQRGFRPMESLLSGPAGGLVGAASVGRKLGIDRIITLDMGGTSADAARFEGHFDLEPQTLVGPVHMSVPALAIETVAAGGGSICWFDGQKLNVGPESAGARPGPASYGAGGPLCLTDVNVLLGRLDPESMGIPLDEDAARSAFDKLLGQINERGDSEVIAVELLKGLLRIANEKMAEAIRQISLKKGFDSSQYTLLAFGGAGGMHACQIADILDIQHLLFPYEAGILSASGISKAKTEVRTEKQVLKLLDHCSTQIGKWLRDMLAESRDKLIQQGISPSRTEVKQVRFLLRMKGQEDTLDVDFQGRISRDAPTDWKTELSDSFRKKYVRIFGYEPDTERIEIERIRLILAEEKEEIQPASLPKSPIFPQPDKEILPLFGNNQSHPVFYWDQLKPGHRIEGPALIANEFGTVFLEKGWWIEVRSDKDLVGWKTEVEKPEISTREENDPVALELFSNRFSAIAQEMGIRLQRSAMSVNVKERMDFSCALLDPEAELLVNAPHIPVHLGSLGICARLVLRRIKLGPGDVVITNHPKYGGSHLPDVTLISGAFTRQGELIGYLVNRAHHAEIGGKRPGSMPPDARNLAEEGVVISPMYLVESGKPRFDALRELLSGYQYPSRSVEENLADIRAALASLRAGEQALCELEQKHGLPRLHYYMDKLKKSADLLVRETLREIMEERSYSSTEYLDDGTALQVRLRHQKHQLLIDFSGSGPVHPGNLNANLSIVYSVVIYVLRLLCGHYHPKKARVIPLNEGLLKNVRIHVPENCLLHPDFPDDPLSCPAVVGGNTEVSQRLTDTLLKALKIAACSQGTMNNFLFGNENYGYYETIGGGVGALSGFNGRSAVHQHMTNTRITDPELLEFRYPVQIVEFSIRRGSGGKGKWIGGNGLIREYRFRSPHKLTLLSQHRKEGPYGIHGGAAGQVGEQFLFRSNGSITKLEGMVSLEVKEGDRVRILTPGGGGWGADGHS